MSFSCLSWNLNLIVCQFFVFFHLNELGLLLAQRVKRIDVPANASLHYGCFRLWILLLFLLERIQPFTRIIEFNIIVGILKTFLLHVFFNCLNLRICFRSTINLVMGVELIFLNLILFVSFLPTKSNCLGAFVTLFSFVELRRSFNMLLCLDGQKIVLLD